MAALKPNPAGRSAGRTRLRVVLGLLFIGFGLWLLIQRHFGNLAYFVITSESMEPTLNIGDRVIMEKQSHYQVGEIVVIEKPDHSGGRLVKRILAMEGDLVTVHENDVDVVHLTKPYPATTGSRTESQQIPKVAWLIKEGEVFVVGDNRDVSEDSRDFGPLPVETIHGVVRRRFVSRFKWAPVK